MASPYIPAACFWHIQLDAILKCNIYIIILYCKRFWNIALFGVSTVRSFWVATISMIFTLVSPTSRSNCKKARRSFLRYILPLPSLKLTASSHPENAWLEDDPFRFGMAYFQGRTVTFREGTFYNPHFHRIPMVVNGSNSRLDMDIGRAAESARVTSSRCPDSSGAVYLIQWVRRVTSKVDNDGIPCSWTNLKHPGMA